MAKRIKGSNVQAVITDGKVTGLAVNGQDIGVVTATKSAKGVDISAAGVTSVDRIKKALSASRQDIFSVDPWSPADAHAVSTAYKVGDAVTAGGNTYVCLIAGTSASATPPAATTFAPIVDGSVTWLYFGAAPVAPSNPPTAAVSGSVPAPLTKAWSALSGESWFRIRGGTYTVDPANGIGWTLAEPKNSGGLCVEFMTDSQDVVMIFRYGSVPVRISVDDRFVAPGTLTASGTNYFRVQMPGVRKARKVSVFWNGSHSFFGVRAAPSDSVWKTAYPHPFNFYMVGDSYVAGSTYHPGTPDRALHLQIASALGASQYQSDGVGGSGYVAHGSGVVFGDPLRLARIPANQDLILVAGGINDGGTLTQTAVSAYLVALRAAQPTAMIYVMGAWSGSTGPSAAILSAEAYIRGAVTALADPKMQFLPCATAPAPYLAGTGNVGGATSDGNADIYIAPNPDKTHPMAQALTYLASRVAKDISLDVMSRF